MERELQYIIFCVIIEFLEDFTYYYSQLRRDRRVDYGLLVLRGIME